MFEYKANFYNFVNISVSFITYFTAMLGLYPNIIQVTFVMDKDGSFKPSFILKQDIKNKISNFVV